VEVNEPAAATGPEEPLNTAKKIPTAGDLQLKEPAPQRVPPPLIEEGGAQIKAEPLLPEPLLPAVPEQDSKRDVVEFARGSTEEPSRRENFGQEPSRMHRGDLLTAGPGVEPPRLIDRPQPVYPRRARRRNKEARVVVKVLVDEEGKVLQAIAPPDRDGFGEAAREAALGARFDPAKRDGVAGKMWRNLPFEFKVE
jgi:TonB family protein